MVYPARFINKINDDEDLKNRLSEIQANILTPHGCDNVACLFISLGDVTSKMRTWISKFSKNITTANLTPKSTQDRIKYNKENVTINFHISHTSFKKLGIRKDPFDSEFSHGMKNATKKENSTRIKDKKVSLWEEPYQKNLDILITFGSDSKEKLMHAIFEVYKDLQLYDAEITNKFVEFGEWRYGHFGEKVHRVEPFGYRDGLSKVHFFKKDGKNLIRNRWKIVLDEYGGSYLVFRKLEQNISQFNKKVKEIAETLNIPIAYAEAQIVGRFKNGEPLTYLKDKDSTDSNIEILEKFNDYNIKKERQFDYSDDSAGKKCPFHAHIRKVNPREEKPLMTIDYDQDNTIPSRIVRRGIPYQNKDKVGMLFMCYQQNLRNHFLKIHNDWMNCSEFPTDSRLTGTDPLSSKIYEKGLEIEKPKLYWNDKWDDNDRKKTKLHFGNVIDFVGGEYFYTPNVKFLEQLSLNEEE